MRFRPIAALVPTALFLLAFACSDDAPPKEALGGSELWKQQGCGTCHGAEGRGTGLAPSVRGKREFWTRGKLVAYFQDPHAYIAGDARLRAQGAKYSQQMLSYRSVPARDLETLADYVLALE